MEHQPLVILFIGPPGSGKTYFSTKLAARISAVRLSSDAVRLALFGSIENIEKLRRSDKESLLYTQVFGVIDYVSRQVLGVGQSVIIDAQAKRRSDRIKMTELAYEFDAKVIVVWIQTPPELATQRGMSRSVSDDSIRYSESQMQYFLADHAKVLEPPEYDENVIFIDGKAPFDAQYAEFQMQLKKMLYS